MKVFRCICGAAAVAALAGCGTATHPQAVAPAPKPEPRPAVRHCDPAVVHPAGTGTQAVAAVALHRVAVLRSPGGAAIRIFPRLNQYGVPTVFAVAGFTDTRGCKPAWYRVAVPVRPNGTAGWLPARAVQLVQLDAKIVIHVRAARLELLRAGRVVLRTPIAPGAPSTPTPLGRFFVTERLVPQDPSGPYGPAALGTSAFSPVLKDWAQGGPVGIHGTNEPWAIGHPVSHGCIRLPNAAMARLFRQVPAGTPIVIER